MEIINNLIYDLKDKIDKKINSYPEWVSFSIKIFIKLCGFILSIIIDILNAMYLSLCNALADTYRK